MSDPDKPSSALVVPLTSRELPGLVRNFLLWGMPSFSPVAEGGARPRVALRLLWNDAPDKARESFIDEIFQRAGCASSFAEVVHDHCDLAPDEDHYDRRPTSGPVSPLGFYAGPNRMFFEVIERFGSLYPALFLMETDCFPLVPGWLARIFDGFAATPSVWVGGSRYSGIGRLPRSKRRHLNGNALYRTGDTSFLDFVSSVWKPQLERYVRDRDPKVAYDSFLEEFASEWAPTPGRDSLGELKRTLEERFQPTPLIRNYGGAEDTRRLGWTLERVRREHPEALVVHGQWFAGEASALVASARPDEWGEAETRTAAFAKSGVARPVRPAGSPVWRNRVELGGAAWFFEERFEFPRKGDRLLFRHRLAPSSGGRRLAASVRFSEPTEGRRVEALLVSPRERPSGFGLAALRFFSGKIFERTAVFLGAGACVRATSAGHRRWKVERSETGEGSAFELEVTCPGGVETLELWIEISGGPSPESGFVRIEADLCV